MDGSISNDSAGDSAAHQSDGPAVACAPQYRELLSGHGRVNSRVSHALKALIADSRLYLEYFSNKVIYSKAAEQEVVPPDRKPLPNLV